MICISTESENGPWTCSGDVDDPDPDPPPNICHEEYCFAIPATLTIEAATPVAAVNSETYVSIVGGVSASEEYEFETYEPDAERLSLVVGFYDTVGIGATVTVTSDGVSYETETPD